MSKILCSSFPSTKQIFCSFKLGKYNLGSRSMASQLPHPCLRTPTHRKSSSSSDQISFINLLIKRKRQDTKHSHSCNGNKMKVVYRKYLLQDRLCKQQFGGYWTLFIISYRINIMLQLSVSTIKSCKEEYISLNIVKREILTTPSKHNYLVFMKHVKS